MEHVVLYSADEIQQRIGEVAEQLKEFYAGKPVVAVCVLKGAFIFFADLVRKMSPFEIELDFVRLSSYQDSSESSGKVLFSKDMEIDIQGKHVLIVEDIVDTGQTITFLADVFKARKPESIRVCTLIDKTERRQKNVDIDFSCFSVEEGFIVGYGLDYAEKYRHLADLCILNI